ncbi:S8 family serine peptidase [Seonamhaeicola sp. MEBiC1930]|uniref:S8 family serine peptidase n=1 Tax=Seonamhaeicola sp. MEBiC01930 TaxID=2976768 RepID=UPI00325196C5
MTNKYFQVNIGILLCFFFFYSGFSQNSLKTKEVVKDYDIEKLKKLEISFEKSFYSNYNDAIKEAKRNNWQVKYTRNTTDYHLKKVINGKPIYLRSFNVNAAVSTRTNYLHNGGGLGLDLEGQDMTVHIWEVGGTGLLTHNEYDGAGGTDRLSVGDGETATSNHAAHVTGTIIASGVTASAKGMAPQASAIGYNSTNDLAEATAAAASGMLLSNHSYGYGSEDFADDLSWFFGAYIQESKDWDDLMYNAPYYLPVFSAGNSGDSDSDNSNPLGSNALYDKLLGDKTAKNPLIVASGSDAVINVDGTLGSSTRSSFSSEGPTDDLRIKPDIMGNGESLTSTSNSTSASPVLKYSTLSGTSMAAPNVCGSLLLLQQHHNNLYGSYMKSATLKGLALHTADDVDSAGPDANSGWGLLNAKVAAETISENGFSTWISEERLNNGESFTFDVVSDGTSPLLASISWTDQGGIINQTGVVNDGNIYFNDDTAALVNDLDIRVTQTTNTYTPWKLLSVDTNGQGDNTVDPYERVDVSGAAGTYTITVTHKGTLAGGSQDFSLIVTGLSSNFTLNTQSTDQSICSSNNATYSFNYLETGGATTNFSLNGVPTGATTSITPNSLNADGSFDVTFSNLENVSANTYNISVIGDDGNETETRIISLRVLHSDFTPYPQSLSSPANGAANSPSSLSLNWAENLNAESYLVEVSTNPSFSSIDYSSTETDLSFELAGLSSETVYYWRVRPDNNCNTGNYSETYSFQVGNLNCGSNVFTATDFSDATIGTTAGVFASVPVTVSTGGLNIESVKTSFKINHTWVNDINITLEGPASIGNPQVLLFDSSCATDTGGDTTNPGDGNDFDVTYSDSGSVLFCDDAVVPSISGTIAPLESLSEFVNLAADGEWKLKIGDPNNNDGGAITEFSLDICVINDITSIPNLVNNGFSAPLNGTYTFQNSDFEATSSGETAAEQIFTIITLPSVGVLEKNSAAMSIGDTFTQDDVNTGKITFTNTQTSTFNDSFLVDIRNTAKGWLSNQNIVMNSTLDTEEFVLKNINIWPNPASKSINIKIGPLTSNNNVKINLFDIQGRVIKSFDYQVTSNSLIKTIDLNNIFNGVYLLEVRQGNSKTTSKIIVNQ